MNNKILLENLRCIPDFPQKGINFRDVTTLFKNGECMHIMLEELYELYKDKGVTKIVGIESRGFVMASALACKLGAGVVLCRKPGKLPAATVRRVMRRSMAQTPSRYMKTPSTRMMLYYCMMTCSQQEEP